MTRLGLTALEQERVRLSRARGALHAALGEVAARGLDVDRFFPLLIGGGTLADAADPAAVLHGRVQRWTEARGTQNLVATELSAGLVPRVREVTDRDLGRALNDRIQAMQRRARHLAAQPIASRPDWLRTLGSPPEAPTSRISWTTSIATVAAYGERWALGSDPRPLGSDKVQSVEQLTHRRHAQVAVAQAQALTRLIRPLPPDAVEISYGIERERPQL